LSGGDTGQLLEDACAPKAGGSMFAAATDQTKVANVA
jgi:hypothetical protein